MIATNENDILARTLETGRYEPRHVMPTDSPSMDIQISSNFERLLFEASGRDAPVVTGAMAALRERQLRHPARHAGTHPRTLRRLSRHPR